MVSIWPIICLLLEPFGLLNCNDTSIVELRSNTFDQFISDNQFVMVKFYTPWCQHCKSFRSEYSTLSKSLQVVDSKIKLAQVNVADEKKLGAQNEIKTFPTLKFFINGKPMEYHGKRIANVINSWMSRKMDPIQILETLDDIETLMDDAELLVIGFFDDPNSKQAEAFKSAVDADDTTIQFATVTTLDLRTEFGVENNQVIMYKNFDDKQTVFEATEFSADSLTKFFTITSRPLLIDFKLEIAAKLFKNNANNNLFVFASKTDEVYVDIEDELRALSKKLRDNFLFIVVNLDQAENFKISNMFGVDLDLVPTYRVVTFDEGITKYKPNDPKLTIDGVKQFIADFLADAVAPDLLSQELPSDWNANPVIVLVSSNFDEIVFDAQKDVLVEFYSPRCGHCKSMEKVYNELGEFYRDSKNVVIAKMDATVNELVHTKIRGYPTIKLYRRGDNEVMNYKGSRTLKDFIAFVEETQNTTKPDVNDEL